MCLLPELSHVFWQAVPSRTLVVFGGLLQGGGKEQYITTLIVLLLHYKEVKSVGGSDTVQCGQPEVVHPVIESLPATYALNHSCC